MPELPEVETTKNGISPYVVNKPITKVIIRNPQLRWPIPQVIKKTLAKQRIESITRRSKYLLCQTTKGHLILHLGMSGRLQIVDQDKPVGKHDHFEIHFHDQTILRFTDPRRFGAILWTQGDPQQHQLLAKLGPEPLSEDFSTEYLFERSRKHRIAIKSFIMDAQIVVGVGNIYAQEALFLAGIHPKRAANQVSVTRYQQLVITIKQVLTAAIEAGGTTLRDFRWGENKPGYFQQQLNVYGRADQTCIQCGSILKLIRLNQRSTVYCPKCQR